MAVLRQEDVLRLDVPVDDPLPVGRREPFGHLKRDVEGLAQRKRSAGQKRAQRLALQKLRDDERNGALFPDVEEGEDVRMREGGDGLRLLLETGKGARVVRDDLGQNLDGHVAAQPRVPGPVDLTHSPRAQGCEDFVGAETGARADCHEALTGFYPWGVLTECWLTAPAGRSQTAPGRERLP